jgi:hypothetical protein
VISRRRVTLLFGTALLLLTIVPVEARARRWADVTESLLRTARDHQQALEASIPAREREVREAQASLDRNSELYTRGVVPRASLEAAARDVARARGQLDSTRQQLTRTTTLVAEIEARRRIAALPPLRPGQYEASELLVRYYGAHGLSPAAMTSLQKHFVARAGRVLPVSATGQTDVHTQLGFDHRHAVDIALHPDTDEGRLVMAWLRERGIAFLAFRGARTGAATGAHIHVGRPSERIRTAGFGGSTSER